MELVKKRSGENGVRKERGASYGSALLGFGWH